MTIQALDSVAQQQTLTYFKPTSSDIKFGKMHFLITDRPSIYTMDNFIKELQRRNVKKLVRVCEPTYPKCRLQNVGIEVLDWEFNNGTPPPAEIIEKWLSLVKEYFLERSNSGSSTKSHCLQMKPLIHHHNETATPKPVAIPKAIAIHCVSGLGRAPVMVGIALLEAGMKCEDVIYLIRTSRRGALNEKQLEFLKNYIPSGKLLKLNPSEKREIIAKTRKLMCNVM